MNARVLIIDPKRGNEPLEIEKVAPSQSRFKAILARVLDCLLNYCDSLQNEAQASKEVGQRTPCAESETPTRLFLGPSGVAVCARVEKGKTEITKITATWARSEKIRSTLEPFWPAASIPKKVSGIHDQKQPRASAARNFFEW